MGTEHSSRCQEVVRHKDKQARLDQFLGFYLDRIFADWTDCPEQHHLTMIARSPASPIARAVMINSPDLLSAGVAIRAIFSKLEPAPLLSEWTDLVLVSAESDVAPTASLSRINTPGLIDLHEQMVLGQQMSWCGDAMRRDPLQRDTIEVYDPCCNATALQSLKTFEAVWLKGETMQVDRRLAGEGAGNASILGDSTHTEGTTLASTRH